MENIVLIVILKLVLCLSYLIPYLVKIQNDMKIESK